MGDWRINLNFNEMSSISSEREGDEGKVELEILFFFTIIVFEMSSFSI